VLAQRCFQIEDVSVVGVQQWLAGEDEGFDQVEMGCRELPLNFAACDVEGVLTRNHHGSSIAEGLPEDLGHRRKHARTDHNVASVGGILQSIVKPAIVIQFGALS
jgi:hypothetical protein